MTKEKVITTKKVEKSSSLANTSATTSVDKDMYVLTVHKHYDDYKRADSESKTLGVFKNVRDAHFTAIRILLSRNCHKFSLQSPTMIQLIPSLFPEDEFKDWLLLENSSVEEVLAIIITFGDDSLRDIYEELNESLSEEEAKYTMRASQTTVTVSKLDFIDTIETGKYEYY